MSLEMKYFVLKPKGDNPYAAASRIAMKAYAEAIIDENALLYNDLEQWRLDEQHAVNEAKLCTYFKEK